MILISWLVFGCLVPPTIVWWVADCRLPQQLGETLERCGATWSQFQARKLSLSSPFD